MGRYRLNFSLYRRKVSKGTFVYYYRTYKPDGSRTSGISTGCTSKAKAINYCQNLFKEGKLYRGESVTFGCFAEGMFEENSEWYKLKNQNNRLTKTYLTNLKSMMNTKIMPYFKDIKLNKINLDTLLKYQKFLEEELHLKQNSVNTIIGLLKNILKFALYKNLISSNPFTMYKMKRVDAKKDAFTLEELIAICNSEWENVSARNLIITSALTGMRFSEILGLHKSDFKDGYIYLEKQFILGEYRELKNKTPRIIPICDELKNLICSTSDSDIIFPKAKPYYEKIFKPKFNEYIKDISERGITFHSLRHFFNTYLLSNDIPEIKVAMIMGHKSGLSQVQMRYTNFKKNDYKEISKIQKNLFNKIIIK